MHELVCPRFTHDHSPCNFQVTYLPPRFLDSKQDRMKHLYSYVVLKKGSKNILVFLLWFNNGFIILNLLKV